MSSSSYADTIQELLGRSLRILAIECPAGLDAMAAAAAGLTIGLDIDGERLAVELPLDGNGTDIGLWPDPAPTDGAISAWIGADRPVVADVLAGHTSLVQALDLGLLRIIGPLDHVVRAHDAIVAFIHAAVRSPSMQALPDDLTRLWSAPSSAPQIPPKSQGAAAMSSPVSSRPDARESDAVVEAEMRASGEKVTALVLGAGIAGLTAAHELAIRGFEVTVVEAEEERRFGGLAATQYRRLDESGPAQEIGPVPLKAFRPAPLGPPNEKSETGESYADRLKSLGTAAEARFSRLVNRATEAAHAATGGSGYPPEAPGEHGFRFFPAYYLHLFDTLQRIPIYEDGRPTHRTVYHNLVEVSSQAVTTPEGRPSLIFPRRPPSSLAELYATLQQLSDAGVGPGDIETVLARIARYLSTSPERRARELEDIATYEYFVGLDPRTGHHAFRYSFAIEQLLRNMPRVLAAFDSEWGDARTNISTYLQLQLRMSEAGNKADAVLNGPTTEQWFRHWRHELERLGVRFLPGHRVVQLNLYDDHGAPIVPTRLDDEGKVSPHTPEPALDGLRRAVNTSLRRLIERGWFADSVRRLLVQVVAVDSGITESAVLSHPRVLSILLERTVAALITPPSVTPPGRDEVERSMAWLVDDDVFKLLADHLQLPPATFTGFGERRDLSDGAWLDDLWACPWMPVPQDYLLDPDDQKLLALLATFRSAAQAGHLRVEVVPEDRKKDARTIHALAADYVVCALPAHVAETVTATLRRLGVGGAVSELAGFTTSAPPSTGPLLRAELRYPADRDPCRMDQVGTKPWDRFQVLAGIQYFFDTEFQLARGHVYYSGSPWALSSINQHGLWERRPSLAREGYVSVLSVDIGNWQRKVPVFDTKKGKEIDKSAADCTPDELAREVWRQITVGLLGDDETTPPPAGAGPRSRRHEANRWFRRLPTPAWYAIDANIRYQGDKAVENTAPYLVPIVGDWCNRPGGHPWNPDATSLIVRPTRFAWERAWRDGMTWQARQGGYQIHSGSLVFAGAWCRTFTRMTSMEAACESGRHATNAILDHFLWKMTNEARENAGPAVFSATDPMPLEHMTGPVRYPTARGDYCFIFDIENREPSDFRPIRLLDERFLFEQQPHPLDLMPAGYSATGSASIMPVNPLSAEYFDWMAGQLRNWRSLLEGLERVSRPGNAGPDRERRRRDPYAEEDPVARWTPRPGGQDWSLWQGSQTWHGDRTLWSAPPQQSAPPSDTIPVYNNAELVRRVSPTRQRELGDQIQDAATPGGATRQPGFDRMGRRLL